MKLAAEMPSPDAIEPNSHWQMEVSDHSGRLIYRFTFTAEEV